MVVNVNVCFVKLYLLNTLINIAVHHGLRPTVAAAVRSGEQPHGPLPTHSHTAAASEGSPTSRVGSYGTLWLWDLRNSCASPVSLFHGGKDMKKIKALSWLKTN